MLKPLYHCPTLNDTEACAQVFGRAIGSVALPFWISLEGELGAGKTAFMRALLTALGINGKIKSPTYTLLESYTTIIGQVHHFDLYRMQHPSEWQASGFAETAQEKAVFAVEWYDRAGSEAPPPDLVVCCAYLNEEGRSYEFMPMSPKAKALIHAD